MDYRERKYYTVTFLAIYHNDIMCAIKNCTPSIKITERKYLQTIDDRFIRILVSVSCRFGDEYNIQLNKFFDKLSKIYYLAVREVTKENYEQ